MDVFFLTRYHSDMSDTIFIVHIVGALFAGVISFAAFLHIERASFWSRSLSFVFVSDIASGLALAISRKIRVLYVCDNLVLYALLFIGVQSVLLYKANSQRIGVSKVPLLGGLGVSLVSVLLVFAAGF